MTALPPPAPGPLVVSEQNPRYFRVAGEAFRGTVLYLTGSHIWDDFHDEPGRDHGPYLDLLTAHGHNFIRLWRKPRAGQAAVQRADFERLRARVAAAGERGIYVSVMLDEHDAAETVRAVGALPNVLYAVSDEASAGAVRAAERALALSPHPVGSTPGANEDLWSGPTEWISPGHGRWFEDPPASDGRKVVLLDTAHVAPGRGDALWVWKAFLRGHNPLVMDTGLAGLPSFASFGPARRAMGDTRRWAERIALAELTPRGELASTGYVLAKPGCEYLVLQTGDGGAGRGKPFTVSLVEGRYAVEWFVVETGEIVRGEAVQIEWARDVTFRAPVRLGPAVLHLATTRDLPLEG